MANSHHYFMIQEESISLDMMCSTFSTTSSMQKRTAKNHKYFGILLHFCALIAIPVSATQIVAQPPCQPSLVEKIQNRVNIPFAKCIFSKVTTFYRSPGQPVLGTLRDQPSRSLFTRSPFFLIKLPGPDLLSLETFS